MFLGKDGGMIRVTNQETKQRALIKNLKEDIKDLAFAYSRSLIILGCVDNEGNILVYQIDDTPHSISCKVLLHVFHRNNRPHSNYRLIWCSYLPSFEDEIDSADDPEKMFVVLNGSKGKSFITSFNTDTVICGFSFFQHKSTTSRCCSQLRRQLLPSIPMRLMKVTSKLIIQQN